MRNLYDMCYAFKRMYVYKRQNVRVEFDHPNMSNPEARLQYKVKLFGIIPFWKTVFNDNYCVWDRPTAIEDPFEYSRRMMVRYKTQVYARSQLRKVRQMQIKLKNSK
jgi:hypothetical protein